MKNVFAKIKANRSTIIKASLVALATAAAVTLTAYAYRHNANALEVMETIDPTL